MKKIEGGTRKSKAVRISAEVKEWCRQKEHELLKNLRYRPASELSVLAKTFKSMEIFDSTLKYMALDEKHCLFGRIGMRFN